MANVSPTNSKHSQQSIKNQLKSLQISNFLTCKSNIATLLGRRYDQLLRSEKYTDCLFHVGGQHVKCHKLILSAASPVFEAMFYGPCSRCEAPQEQPQAHHEIEILDISPEMFQVLIHYIYSGLVEFEDLTLEETIELYYCAEKYIINDLINDCLMAITRKLRFSNILPALELCVCMDLGALLDVCMSFFERCCLGDPQYMAYHKSHYYHITKECIKTLIALNKGEQKTYQHLLCFVYEWCQQECRELGLQKTDCTVIIDDLNLKDSRELLTKAANAVQMQQIRAIERSYYKACRPFVVDRDGHEFKLFVKCDRFISLRGIIMHSRLTPNINGVALTPLAYLTHNLTLLNEYNESLRIEISSRISRQSLESIASSDGEDESDPEVGNVVEVFANHEPDTIIWQHTVSKKPTKYNCDMNINWDEGVILSPDVEYEIKIIWQSDAFGSEYPCSFQSDIVDGIEFHDSNSHNGSLVKGLRYVNLV